MSAADRISYLVIVQVVFRCNHVRVRTLYGSVRALNQRDQVSTKSSLFFNSLSSILLSHIHQHLRFYSAHPNYLDSTLPTMLFNTLIALLPCIPAVTGKLARCRIGTKLIASCDLHHQSHCQHDLVRQRYSLSKLDLIRSDYRYIPLPNLPLERGSKLVGWKHFYR